MQSSINKIITGGSLFLATCCIAVVGYYLAGWGLLDAVYMVIITIFGVGYGEVRPVADPTLKVFTIGVIIIGCSSLIYVTGGFIQMITEGEINKALGARKTAKGIGKLSGHVIICGFGRVGRILARELKAAGRMFVVIDAEGGRVRQADEAGYIALNGDASEESTLQAAGIERARVLATVLPNDAVNVFITLTARELNENLEIIARAESESSEKKLLRSGANRVVLPSAIGAARISQMITMPSESAVLADDSGRLGEDLERLGLRINEITIDQGSALAGRTVGELKAGQSVEFVIAAVVRTDGAIERRPANKMVLETGDKVLFIAHREEMAALAKRASGQASMLYRGVSY